MYDRVYLIPFETDPDKRGSMRQCPKYLDIINKSGHAVGLIGKESYDPETKQTSWREPYYVLRMWREKEEDFAELEAQEDVVRLDGDHAKTNADDLTAAGVDISELTVASTATDYRTKLAEWLIDDGKFDVTSI